MLLCGRRRLAELLRTDYSHRGLLLYVDRSKKMCTRGISERVDIFKRGPVSGRVNSGI